MIRIPAIADRIPLNTKYSTVSFLLSIPENCDDTGFVPNNFNLKPNEDRFKRNISKIVTPKNIRKGIGIPKIEVFEIRLMDSEKPVIADPLVRPTDIPVKKAFVAKVAKIGGALM